MEADGDKNWSSRYLLDPLYAPDPSAETGPGTSFRPAPSTPTPSEPSPKASKNPFVRNRNSSASSKIPSTHTRTVSGDNQRNSYPSPPQSASPRQGQFAHRQDAFGDYRTSPTQQQGPSSGVTGRRRGSSLTERFPGDKSHRPLDMLTQEAKAAHRAPHLRKKHQVRPDMIDDLDTVGGAKYHHEGPFDVSYLARNTSYESSPLEALSGSNEETLKATPREKIMDSVQKHRPLDGVAMVPPGMHDRNGNLYEYQEGPNMMIEDGGNYKRWPGVRYLPEDIKGKGEPSYTVDKALKEHKGHRKAVSSDIEMTSRPRSSEGAARAPGRNEMWGDGESSMGRSNTTGRKSSGTLKKRFASLRRHES